MRYLITVFLLATFHLNAQVSCDPSGLPTGLESSYTAGSGALLQWDAVPLSEGVLIKATTPDGAAVQRRLMGTALDQVLIPDALLSPGLYTWRIQIACSVLPPYSVTPISMLDSFVVGTASSCPATVTDIDGNSYATVEIGAQCWMKENLRTEHYNDGSDILTGLDNSSWSTTTTGAFAVYDDDSTYKEPYGLFYKWYTVEDVRGICPTGWHVPSDDEWTDMLTVLDPSTCGSCIGSTYSPSSGIQIKSSATDSPAWDGSNSSGFSAPATGVRTIFGSYVNLGFDTYFWTSTEFSSSAAYFRKLVTSNDATQRFSDNKRSGMSVRCLKD